ncbi:S-layer homology domain-containing protein [candidate division WOR-3 bacterium]|nr:S-layer homology domain-containing protein [candidate division WOR-3 bacterium]
MKRLIYILIFFLVSCSTTGEVRSLKTIKMVPEIIRVSNPDTFLQNVEAVSRGELAYLIETRFSSSCILELFPIKNSDFPKDISNHWAGIYAVKVSQRDIMPLFPDGSFYPDDPVKKFQLAIVFYKLIRDFFIIYSTEDIYTESWKWAVENGLVSGDRQSYVSGAEAVESVKKICDYMSN